MTNTAALATYDCINCGERERAGLNDGTDRCEGCQTDPETQTFRTPQAVRLEIALAKAHLYESITYEDVLARDDRLVALEAELAVLDGGGCEHAGGDR